MSWKRLLYLFHRWAGIVLCLFFALWFVSGIFMMYVEFPQLSKPERLVGSAAAELLGRDADAGGRAGEAAVEGLHAQGDAECVRASRRRRARATSDGTLDPPGDDRRAAGVCDSARQWSAAASRVRGQRRGATKCHDGDGRGGRGRVQQRSANTHTTLAFDGSVQTDQWTVSAALNDHRPLLKYAVDDPAGTVLYVSSVTGEVVRDTHGTERVLNYFAAVTHWLYPTFVRKYPLLWEWIVDILSGVGVVARNHRSVDRLAALESSRQAGQAAGALQGTHALALFHRNHLRCADGHVGVQRLAVHESAESQSAASSAGGSATRLHRQVAHRRRFRNCRRRDSARLRLKRICVHYVGHSFYRVTDRDGDTRMVAGSDRATTLPDAKAMLALAPHLIPERSADRSVAAHRLRQLLLLASPGAGERPLPIIRVRFDDERHTWFHLDPLTGQILDRSTRTNRVYRWLYNGLHSFDIWWLWQRRPLWDICVIVFSLGGLLLSVIGVVIGWRRLRYEPRRRTASAVAPHA